MGGGHFRARKIEFLDTRVARDQQKCKNAKFNDFITINRLQVANPIASVSFVLNEN